MRRAIPILAIVASVLAIALSVATIIRNERILRGNPSPIVVPHFGACVTRDTPVWVLDGDRYRVTTPQWEPAALRDGLCVDRP